MHMSCVPDKLESYIKTSKIQMKNAVRTITLLWLVIHFLLTMLYVYPDNPVKERLQPLLDATIGRYFSQGWALFAPEPDNTDVVLLVRPLTPHEYNVVQTQGLPSNGWYDLSSPLWTKLQNSRFSAYGKLSRAVSKALYAYFNLIDTQRMLSASFKEMNNSKALYAAHDLPQGQQEQLMLRAASVFCKDIGQTNARYVALMAREIFAKPWSKRATSEPQAIENSLLGVYAIDQSVEDTHMYQIGGQ
jgi:hypothetical protein